MSGLRTWTLSLSWILLSLLPLCAVTAQDLDGDGIADGGDNCPAIANPEQADTDGDGFGTLCDCEDPAHVFQRRRGEQAALIAVRAVTDLDGDGVDDLILGEQPPRDDCVDSRAKVVVVSGSTRGRHLELLSGEPCDAFGSALSAAGDYDGDGLDDILVGAERGGSGGRVYVFSGATGDLVSPAGTPFTFEAQRPGDRFGACVAGIGDVDQDGLDDVAVGSPLHDTNGPGGGRPGRVYVFAGGGTGDPRAGQLLYAIDGQEPDERFGSSLATGGDFDGDGVADIAIGARAASPAAAGRVRVSSGVDGRSLFELAGDSPGHVFGVAVAFAGDVNGDGFDDVVAGAPGRNAAPGGEPGRVYVIGGGSPGAPGREPRLLGVIEGLEAGDSFGTSLAALGDQDGDGFGDIAIGAPGSASGGRSNAGRVLVYSVRERRVLNDLAGRGPNAGFGLLVAAAGDLDRNGRVDLAVSDRWRRGTASIYLLGDGNGNGRRDACEPCRDAETLQPDEPIDFALCPLVPSRCFRIAPAPGKVMRIVLESAPADETVMALGWGVPPTLRSFDEVAERSAEGEQRIAISRARNQTAYVVVESFDSDACTGDLRIRLEAGDAAIITDIVPSSAGSSGVLDTVVRGAGFTSALEFSLAAPSPGGAPARMIPGSTTVVDGETAEVSFDLRGAAAGPYALVARERSDPDAAPVAGLENAFDVRDVRGAALRVSLSGPTFYRSGDRGSLTLRYGNGGDEVIPAPLLAVTAEGADGADGDVEMRLASEPLDAWRPTVQVLGIHRGGPVQALPPGTAGKVRIYFRTRSKCNLCVLRFRVHVFTPDARDFIDWQALPNPDPENYDEDAWRRVLSPLSVNLGQTWRAYHLALLDRARRLARRGQNAASVRSLFRFSVVEAEQRGSAAVLGTVMMAPDFTPLANAMVIARLDGRVSALAQTDAGGRFVLDGVKAGATYDISVREYTILDDNAASVSVPEESYSTGGAGDVLNLVLPVEPRDSDEEPPLPPGGGPSLPERAIVPPASLYTPVATSQVRIVLSRDPNKKTFDVTPGDLLFPTEDEPAEPEEDEEDVTPPPVIEYTIFFENSRCASVAARSVMVVDTLDTDFFDLSTLRLETVSLGEDLEEKLIEFDESADIFHQRRVVQTARDVSVAKVPPVREYPPECETGDLPDCEEAEGADEEIEVDPPDYATLPELEIEVTLRDVPGESAAELVWDIGGCAQPNCNAVVGFLSPNDCSTHQGEGFVCFTVSPEEGVEEVENDVDVIFDDDAAAALSHHVTTSLGPTTPPEAAIDPVPRDNPQGDDDFLVPVDQSLSWAPVLHAGTYRLSVWRLDDTGVRMAGIVSDLELAEPFYRPVDPWELETAYEWEVVATNALGDSPVSAWTFRTESAPPPPPQVEFAVLHPPDGAIATPSDLELAWDLQTSGSEASSFTVYLWDGSDDRSRPTAHVGNTTTYRTNDLELGGTYSWQVVGVNSGGSTESAVWTFTVGGDARAFLRGDANSDGAVNIADAILTLNFLFTGDTRVPCLQAADFDDDGALLITDAVAQVGFLFLGGPPAPPPSDACGADATADDLGCESFPACE